MTATPQLLGALAERALRELDAELLDRPLDQLGPQELGEVGRELLGHCFEAGVARSLRELFEAGRLASWVEETCTAREGEQLLQALESLLGGGSDVGPDDLERLGQVAPLPRERRALQTWAAQYDVPHELMRPAREVLHGVDAGLDLTLSACLLGATSARDRLHLLSELDLDRRAERYLVREARRAAALPARAALWQGTAPGPLRGLVERLRALLVGTGPEQLVHLRFSPGRPVRLSPDSGVCEGLLITGAAETSLVKLYLAGFEQRAIDAECRLCARKPCLHAQALAGRLLDACLWPADRLHAQVVAFAVRPSWQLFFAAARAEPRAAGAHERLAFVLRRSADALSVGVQRETMQADGSFSSGRLVAPSRALAGRALAEHDRALIELLAAKARTLAPSFIPADLALLRALSEHPRVFWEGSRELVRVREEVLEVQLIEHADGMRPEVRLAQRSVAPGARPHNATYLLSDAGNDELCFAALTPALKRLLAALDQFRGVLPRESYAELASYLTSLDTQARVARPRALLGMTQPAPRRFLLRLSPLPAEGIELSLSMRPFVLSGMWPPGAGPELVHGLQDGEPIHARRDLAWEQRAAAELLAELAVAEEGVRVEPYRYLIESTQGALALLSRAARLSERLEIEWAERAARLRIAEHVSAADLKVELFKRGAFFFPEGQAESGRAQLAFSRLLDAARLGERFVRIEGGDYAEIEAALFDRLREAELCLMDGVSIPKLSAGALPFWLTRLGDVCAGGDEESHELAERIRAQAAYPASADVPAALAASLRSYQREGLQFLLSRAEVAPGALLADEMGLGKTVQSIALLCARAALGPAQVVCPTSLVDNWCAELSRFAPSLRVLRYRGAKRREQIGALGPGAVVVLSYELLARDRAHFDGVSFATQVIDEAQVIRNARTVRARAVASIDAKFRVALTGTPLENRLGDLWSVFRVLAPDLLGSWPRFRARFAVPIERYDDRERLASLRRLLGPLLLRRRKDEVATELPARTEVVQLVALSPAERDLYASALSEARRAIGKRRPHDPGRRLHILAELTRLRQLACHPRLVVDDARVESSKLGALMTLLQDVLPRGHRVLIFSQFVSHLALIRERLSRDGIPLLWLTGETPPSERAQLVSRFQAGEGPIFLISLKAGGTGLNLTAADYVVHMDPWWNPAAEDQASDRAHRIGQGRPVSVIKLVAQDTIEERVLLLHTHKRRLAAQLLAPVADARASSDAPLDYEALLRT